MNGWRYAALASLLLAPVAVACSASDGSTGSANGADSAEDPNADDFEIIFPEAYSMVMTGGDHEFKVPATVQGVKNVKWTASPADAVTIEKTDDHTVMLTMKKAGDVTLTAKLGALSSKSKLHIAETTQETWQQGSDRYNNGVVFSRPDGGGGHGQGGGHGDGGGGWQRQVNPSLSCTNCHAKGQGDDKDIEHTPMQTGGYSDDDLVNIMTKATKPEGAKMKTGISLQKWQSFHKWQMNPDEQNGLIVYLRGLEPKSQGDGVDFGGGLFGHHGDGQGGGGGGGGGHHHDDDGDAGAQ